MTRHFVYESDSQPNPQAPAFCARIRVSVEVDCVDGESARAVIQCLRNLDADDFVDFAALPQDEQLIVQAYARQVAEENAVAAFEQWTKFLADRNAERDPAD